MNNTNKFIPEKKMNKIDKSNKNNYSVFNNKKKYGQNKYVTINNFHVAKNESNDDIINNVKDNNAKKIIAELSKPVINTYINPERYSPVIDPSIYNKDNHQDEELNVLKHIKLFQVIRSNNGSPTLGSTTNNDLEKELNDDKSNADILPKNESDEIEEIIFTNEIKNVKDLIILSKKYPVIDNKKYSIDLQKLNNIVPFLEELDNMIGMEDIKVSLTDQLMYFLQGFEYKHALHTIIEGPPGVGKTCLGKILGNIYLNLGCIKNEPIIDDTPKNDEPMSMRYLFANLVKEGNIMNDKSKESSKKLKFKIVKRSDLVGQYVGHTAIKTQKIINESFGGVLFIDEAYSLGGDDVFSRECINTINQNLSEHCDKFVCIIAGYADALENNFFAFNSGLQRRFPFRYKIEKYNGIELSTILKKKIIDEKYSIDTEYEKQLDKYIENNKEYFPNFGGDIETYFFHIKMMHAKRVFGKSIKLRNILIKDDFEKGLEKIKNNMKKEEVKLHMYN
jgi:SpoVK/Ycf46/Vps4 family AAA+-type ATPase